jgi:creatinine amidohydrolase
MPLGRLDALQAAGIYTPIWWYADHPTHYRGDGRAATIEKGDLQLQHEAERLVAAIRLIKQDQETPRLLAEFYGKSSH